MVSPLSLKWIAFAGTLLSGLLGLCAICLDKTPAQQRARVFAVANAFSGGVFLGVALIHMLADAQDVLDSVSAYPFAFLACGASALFVYILESLLLPFLIRLALNNRLEQRCVCVKADCEAPQGAAQASNASSDTTTLLATPKTFAMVESHRALLVAILLLVVISVHSAIAGLALGAQQTLDDVVALMVALLVHKSIASAAICVSLLSTNLSRCTIGLLICLFSCVTPAFIAIGIAAFSGNSDSPAIGAVTACAAGSFLYCALVTLQGNHDHGSQVPVTAPRLEDGCAVSSAPELATEPDAAGSPSSVTTKEPEANEDPSSLDAGLTDTGALQTPGVVVARGVAAVFGFTLMAVVAIWT